MLPAFDVTLERLAYFEHGKRSFTAFLQPGDAAPLAELQARCHALFPTCGDVTSRGEFKPHLTVGRARC